MTGGLLAAGTGDCPSSASKPAPRDRGLTDKPKILEIVSELLWYSSCLRPVYISTKLMTTEARFEVMFSKRLMFRISLILRNSLP